MNVGENSASVIASFAAICENLNDYASDLREKKIFTRVRTGADIRNYRSGWRLEKFVEAELNPKEGHWAVWWIELGRTVDQWFVLSHVSISHTDQHFDLDEFTADSPELLDSKLQIALKNLEAALHDHIEFRDGIRRYLSQRANP